MKKILIATAAFLLVASIANSAQVVLDTAAGQNSSSPSKMATSANSNFTELYGAAPVDTVYGADWGSDTTAPPTRHAVYTKIESLTTGDIPDSTDRRYVTDTEHTVVGNTSGTNTGDQNAAGVSVADTNGDYTATDVEGVLAEIAPQLGGGSGTNNTLAAGVNAITLNGQEIGTNTVIEAIADTTAVAGGIFGYNASGAFEVKTVLNMNLLLGAGINTAYSLGHNGDKLTMRNGANDGTIEFTGTLVPDAATYSLALTFADNLSGDSITVGGTAYSANATITGLTGVQTLTQAFGGTNDTVTWGGTDSGLVYDPAPNTKIDMDNANRALTATFSASGGSPDYAFYWSGNTGVDADYNSGASLTATTVGAFVQSAAAAQDGAGGGDTVDTSDSHIDFAMPAGYDSTEGTISFLWNFQTAPANNTFIRAMRVDGGSELIRFKHESGYLYIEVLTDNARRNRHVQVDPVVGTTYHIIGRWKLDGADSRIMLEVDGVTQEGTYSTDVATVTPDTVSVGSTNIDCYIDEFYIYPSYTQVVP